MAYDDTSSSGRFLTTHWSVVQAARESGNDSSAFDAMETLCNTYWYPVYAFIRRRGNSSHDAQDLAQGFFARFLEKDYLKTVDPDKGKFRSFLLTTVKHFLANEYDREQAQKRGGDRIIISLDAEQAESRFTCEAAGDDSPEAAFDREWALTLLQNVIDGLRQDYQKAGKADLFDALKDILTGDRPDKSYAAIAAQFEMTESAVKVTVHRLRSRYRDRLRNAIAGTVSDEEKIDDELRHLTSCV